MLDITSITLLFLVAIIWGITNPMMKQGSSGIQTCSRESDSRLQSLWNELKFLLFNWKYLGPYALNQCGSLLYYYSLGRTELSIAGPLTNALTFVFTYMAGTLIFGERDDEDEDNIDDDDDDISAGGSSKFRLRRGTTKKVGLLLVCTGVLLCLIDKL